MIPALPDRYRVEREIGAGGMATVYAARDLRHDRLVAIKVLRPGVPMRAERFVREIRIAAQLTHPHILPLIDSGESDGLLFYVMPFIAGESLRDRLVRGGELAIVDAIRILRHLLDALVYAHGHGVVHRDVKPENILLSDRHALVADFGVAKAVGAAAGKPAETEMMTAIGAVVGTPAYMAPEQVSGEAVDHRADIYAAGLVAYEMLAGRLPFGTDTPQRMMAAHLASLPTPLEGWRPTTPKRLSAAIMKCLEKRPADRWQSAAELLAEIETVGTDEFREPSSAQAANELVERRFALSERLCRKLNRATLDPRVIGDYLGYVDNQRPSDVLVVFLHGLGLDHRDFGPILERLPYRGLSPTLYGCEPDRRTGVTLSLADHVVILREWLRDVTARVQASGVVLVGFSLGADIGFELLLPSDEPPRVDAFLSLECNLCLGTCMVSRVLAEMTPGDPESWVAELRRFGEGAPSLDAWLNIHEYLVKVIRKFRRDIAPLQRAAADIVRPLRDEVEFETFARWFTNARARVPALRLVFSQSSIDALTRLKLVNLDRGILGEEFPDGVFTVAERSDHFDLMSIESVLRHVDALAAAVREPRAR